MLERDLPQRDTHLIYSELEENFLAAHPQDEIAIKTCFDWLHEHGINQDDLIQKVMMHYAKLAPLLSQFQVESYREAVGNHAFNSLVVERLIAFPKSVSNTSLKLDYQEEKSQHDESKSAVNEEVLGQCVKFFNFNKSNSLAEPIDSPTIRQWLTIWAREKPAEQAFHLSRALGWLEKNDLTTDFFHDAMTQFSDVIQKNQFSNFEFKTGASMELKMFVMNVFVESLEAAHLAVIPHKIVGVKSR